FNITTFRYYISKVKLEGPDGEVFEDEMNVSANADDVRGFYLVNEADASSKFITLKDIPAGRYNKITFTIGIGEEGIEEGAAGGILDPAEGAWFWNWNAGYIGFAIEGGAANSGQERVEGDGWLIEEKSFALHIGGWKEITPADGESFVITQYVKDIAGNLDSCKTTVNLINLNQPVPNQTLVDTFYSCGTLVLSAPTASTCDGQLIYGIPTAGTSLGGNQWSFAPGFDQQVTWIYTNTLNTQTTSQTQKITVTTDTTPPSLTCPMSPAPLRTAPGRCDTSMVAGISIAEVNIYAYSGMPGTYADTCGISMVEYELSGATTVARKMGNNAGVETFELGTTVVTYYVTDL
ncbi:MAG: MbnP family protein, partial [Bacteroidota bacterium]